MADDVARLKAAGFSDQEIKLHLAGFSDDEIKAASTPAAPAKPAENSLQKAWRLTGENARGASDAFKRDVAASNQDRGIIPNVVNMAKPVVDAAAFAAAPYKAVADTMFGDVPVHLPAKVLGMDVPQWAQNVNSKGLTGGDIASAVIPVGAPAAFKGADAIATALNGGARSIPEAASSLGQNIKTLTTAGRRANAASEAMRAGTSADIAASQTGADAQAQVAATRSATDLDRASRLSALAERAKARQAALQERQAGAQASSTPVLPDPAIGTERSLSEAADGVRERALAQQSGIEAKRAAADAEYRSAMEAVAKEQEAKGVGVSDTDAAKALIKHSESIVSPDPVMRPAVGKVPAKGEGAALHNELLDTLKPDVTPLTPEQAAQRKAAGLPVQQDPKGNYSYQTPPSLENVDNFRRRLGDIMDGKVEGYGAIAKIQARRMYKGVTDAIAEYTNGASAPVQQSWAAASKNLEPFERVKAGQRLVGMQPGTSTPSVPSANIISGIVNGGRDAMQQAAAVAGEEPVRDAMRTYLQSTLKGKTSDQILNLTGPNTKLGDIVKADPTLEDAVRAYHAQVAGAEKAAAQSGAQAEALGQRAKTVGSRADQFNKAADALLGSSQKAAGAYTDATAASAGHAAELANLELAAPRDVGKLYSNMLDRAYAEGRISLEQRTAGKQLAASAEKDFALKASRDAWVKKAAVYMGASSLGASGLALVRHH